MRKSFTKILHLVVQINTNPTLYFPGILQVGYAQAYIYLLNYLIYFFLLLFS